MAFLDESFETDDKDSFYVIAVAVVKSHHIVSSRLALREFYGGSALHAAPMFDKREISTLRQATHLVGKQNDGMDIVICAPIQSGTSRDEARAKCLSYAVTKVHQDFGTKLFVLDKLGTPTEDKLDLYTFGDLKRGHLKALSRDAVAVHCRPSEELLLGLPDIAAWAYRQKHTGRDRTWFEPLREFTEVTVL